MDIQTILENYNELYWHYKELRTLYFRKDFTIKAQVISDMPSGGKSNVCDVIGNNIVRNESIKERMLKLETILKQTRNKLDLLSDLEKKVIVNYFLNKRSIKDISKTLKYTESYIRKIKNKAMKKLKEM
jgi:DNA-directed RNA polymerase specialized sigma subunit